MYSLIVTAPSSECHLSVLIFLLIEVATILLATINMVTIMLILCSHILHTSYWLNIQAESGKRLNHPTETDLINFQILRLLTVRANEIFATLINLPCKDLSSVLVIISSCACIRYHTRLSFGSLCLIGALDVTMIFCLICVYCTAGWVWQYSVKIKSQWLGANATGLEKRKCLSISHFGITISSMYVIKPHTLITLFNIILSNICALLIVLKP